MSKNELEALLEAYIPGTGGDWKQSILEVMVAAYNKAIDDAVDAARLNQVKETDYTTYGGKSGVQVRSRYSEHFGKEWDGDSQYWVEVDKDSILKLKI